MSGHDGQWWVLPIAPDVRRYRLHADGRIEVRNPRWKPDVWHDLRIVLANRSRVLGRRA